jgi:hypothetical protein
VAAIAAVAAIATVAAITVATAIAAAVAAIAAASRIASETAEDDGRRLVLTAHEGDSNQREKHRDTHHNDGSSSNPPINLQVP